MEVIYSDLYDIAQRIREIDKGYYPVYNKRYNRFEIYRGSTPSLIILTAEKLDARIIERLQLARKKNIYELAQEIDEYNEETDRRRRNALIAEAEYRAKELTRGKI